MCHGGVLGKVLLQSLQKSCQFKLFLSSTSESHAKLNFAGKSKIMAGKVLHFIPKPINTDRIRFILINPKSKVSKRNADE